MVSQVFISHVHHHRHFEIYEIQMLLGGRAEIDAFELKSNTKYNGGYEEQSPQVIWLWEYIEHSDQERIRMLLTFATGCSFIPVDGLKPPFTVVKYLDLQVEGIEKPSTKAIEGLNRSLPMAHTCFNQLVLPPYTSPDVLNERLTYALENAGAGFYIQ